MHNFRKLDIWKDSMDLHRIQKKIYNFKKRLR